VYRVCFLDLQLFCVRHRPHVCAATDTAARDLPACAMEMVVNAAFYTLASAAPPASDMDDCNDADSLSFS